MDERVRGSDWLGVALPKGRLPTLVCKVLDGVNTYGDLAAKTAHEMGRQRWVGGKSLQLMRVLLAEKGLCFADECLPAMKIDWRDAKELEAVPVRLAATIACLETTLASLRKLQSAITPNDQAAPTEKSL